MIFWNQISISFVIGSYLSYKTPCFKICQEMCVSDPFESIFIFLCYFYALKLQGKICQQVLVFLHFLWLLFIVYIRSYFKGYGKSRGERIRKKFLSCLDFSPLCIFLGRYGGPRWIMDMCSILSAKLTG